MRIEPEFIRRAFPVRCLVKFPNGQYMTMRQPSSEIGWSPPINRRGEIMQLSRKSLARLSFLANATEVRFESMLTLTYPTTIADSLDGPTIKKHLGEVLKYLRKFENLEYLWFLEFTKNEVPHFHVLTTIDRITPKMRFDLMNVWVSAVMSIFPDYDPWFDGRSQLYLRDDRLHDIQTKMSRVVLHKKSWELARNQNGLRGYVAKYAAKKHQKDVPNQFKRVGRFWGTSKGVKPKYLDIQPADEEKILQWLNTERPLSFDNKLRWELAPKYIWIPADEEIPF